MLEAAPEDLSVATLARRLVVGLGLFTLGMTALSWMFSAYIEAGSEWFVDRFGLMGILFGVALIDSFPGTFNEPFLVMGYTSGAGFWRVWFVSSLGSFLSAFSGYGIGWLAASRPGMHALFERFRVGAFMKKYGPVALIVAAVTPLPFALFTWSAGATGLPLRYILVAGLFRFVKIGFYMALIAAGWAAAT
jgi:membrane protein YqaA with SNARE-associated domain